MKQLFVSFTSCVLSLTCFCQIHLHLFVFVSFVLEGQTKMKVYKLGRRDDTIVGDKRYFMSISQWFGLPL